MTLDIEKLEQKLIRTAIVRLRSRVMAMVFGMVGGTGLFVATVWLLVRRGVDVGLHLELLNNFWFLTQMYARFSSRQVGQRRGKTLRMCSCPVRSGAVVCRSIDGRLRGPRSWWGACSAAAGSDASC